jgi:hypothetical protein
VSANKRARQRENASRGVAAQRKTRPLPPGRSLYTPGASRTRQAVEQRSAAPMVFLHQLPRPVLPVVALVLLVTGFTVHGIGGAIALLGVALVLAWLALVSWPRLSRGGRIGRTLVVAFVVAAAIAQAVHPLDLGTISRR